MIRSMTAFGRADNFDTAEERRLTVEIRSVNNRYLDCNLRAPRSLGSLEEQVRSYLQSRGILRGKVDVNVTQETSEGDSEIAVNDRLLSSLLASLYHIRDTYGLKDDISVMTVAANSAVFSPEKADPSPDADKACWEALLPVLSQACDRFLDARQAEGARLRADLQGKLAHLRLLTDRIEALSAENTASYRQRLEARLRAALADHDIAADENRILTECAIWADKVAVDEELVRLRSHYALFDELMDADEPVGRKLDFLIQEMNREVNTTGSKCCSAEIAHLVVEAKNELEKIREQVQNLE